MKLKQLLFASLLFLGFGVNAQINENFNTQALPSGWSSSNPFWDLQPCSGLGSLSFSEVGHAAITPAVNNPKTLNFNKKRGGNAAAWSLDIQISAANPTSQTSGPWTTVASLILADITTACTAHPTIDLSAYTGLRYIRFLDTRAGVGVSGTQRAFDDVVITTNPTITSPTATTITTTSATLGANVTADGGASIIQRGTVWGTAALPTGNSVSTTGTTGVFTTARTGFTPNTLYTYRGYATNSNGTSYSPDANFTTLHNAPTVGSGTGATTSSIVANWTAPTGGGSATFTYEVQVDDDNAFGSVNFTQSNIASGTLTATANTGLTTGTTYFFRVRAVNAGGNSAWSATSVGYATLSPPPTITSFTPLTAKPGDVVTITGTNFNATAANNIIFFGATKATVTAATPTSATVTVPSGATFGAITLLNTSTFLACSSMQFFTPTYSPSKTNIATSDFANKVDFTTSNGPFSVAIGDLDGDSKPDLVAVNQTSNNISIFHNTSSSGSIGSGSFATKVDFNTGAAPFSIAISDLDGDGKPDLVVTNGNATSISVFRNTSTSGTINASSFASPVSFTTNNNPNSTQIPH